MKYTNLDSVNINIPTEDLYDAGVSVDIESHDETMSDSGVMQVSYKATLEGAAEFSLENLMCFQSDSLLKNTDMVLVDVEDIEGADQDIRTLTKDVAGGLEKISELEIELAYAIDKIITSEKTGMSWLTDLFK